PSREASDGRTLSTPGPTTAVNFASGSKIPARFTLAPYNAGKNDRIPPRKTRREADEPGPGGRELRRPSRLHSAIHLLCARRTARRGHTARPHAPARG